MTPKEKAKSGEIEIFETDGEVKVEKGDKTFATIKEDGTLHWHSPVVFDGDIQSLGSKIDLWQTVVSTGDNLIQLNSRIEGKAKEAPYAGIEVNRGDEPSAYLLWTKDSKAWEMVLEGDRKQIASLEDTQKIEGGKGIEVTRDGGVTKVNRKPVTSTQSFWVSNKVAKTKGTDRKILPTFISCLDSETKKVSSIRSHLSSGTAYVTLLKNDKPVAGSYKADQEVRMKDVDIPLEDGDSISIEIDETTNARNLSVSVTILTKF